MKSKFLSFTKYLVLFTLFTGSFQYLVTKYGFDFQQYYHSTVLIYMFLFFVTLSLFSIILYVNIISTENTGYAFVVSSLFKMVLSVIFLSPIIIKEGKTHNADVITFFVPYFLYLFLETFFVVRLLQTKKIK